jgi:hypothetical protein
MRGVNRGETEYVYTVFETKWQPLRKSCAYDALLHLLVRRRKSKTAIKTSFLWDLNPGHPENHTASSHMSKRGTYVNF